MVCREGSEEILVFFLLEFFSGGFALIDTDMWLIVRNRWNFNDFDSKKVDINFV